MSKTLPYILATLALIFLAVGFSKSYAFDIVSSPTYAQRGLYVSSGATQNGNQTYDWYGTYIGTEYQIGLGTNIIYPKEDKVEGLPSNIHMIEFPITNFHTYKYLVSDTSTGIIQIPKDSFMNGGYLVSFDSTNLYYYSPNFTTMTLGSIVQTIAKPSPSFAIKKETVPVYLSGLSGTNFLAYQGTDGKSYKVLDTLASGTDQPITIAGTSTVLPLGKFYKNDLLLARQTSGSGSLYVADGATATPFFETSTGQILARLNTFENPVAYFNIPGGYKIDDICVPQTAGPSRMEDCNTVYKWDLNCQTSGYDSCILNGGVFKCANSAGTLSPGGELCGGTVSVPTGGGDTGSPGTTFSNSGLVCTTLSYPTFSSTPYSIGNATFSDNSSGATLPDRYGFQWISTDGSYRDQFSVYPSTGLYLDTGTFTGGLSAGKTTTIYSDLDAISAGNATSLSVSLTRSGQTSVVNYVKIKTQNQGFSPINSNQKNIVADVRFNGLDGQVHTYPLVYSGGYATALSRFPSNHINIRFTTGTVTFDGFEIGYSNSGTTSKTSCKNSGFACTYTQQSPGVFSCDAGMNVSGIPQGECEIVNNICQPKAGIIPYYDGLIVPGGAIEQAINSSGAVVGLDYQGEDIFSCSETGISVLICPFTVLAKVWGKFTFVIKKLVNLIYGISSLGSPSGQGNIFSFIVPSSYASAPQLSTPFDISGSGTSSTAYTGSDMMNLNKTILKASDNVFNMDSGGIKGIYALSMWFLILVGVVFVIVIFLIAFI